MTVGKYESSQFQKSKHMNLQIYEAREDDYY